MHYDYLALARDTLDRITTEQLANVDAAVDVIAESMLAGGVLQAFGTGHSRIVVHEMSGRAGGLLPVNLVRISDLSVYGDLDPKDLLDPTLERNPAFAQSVYDLIGAQRADPFLIVSNSGINGSVVEMARIVKENGHKLVVITSLQHSSQVDTRAASGQKLYEYGDVVIDSGAPAGDAALELEDGTRTGAISNLAGVFIVQLLTEGICRKYIDAGERPPVYRSMNLPDGDTVNQAFEAQYAGRIRPIEP
ncbi:sugar isomerase domain-containing protein [Frigoribacterium sp. PhB24]|uniref:sugar isomerase domain-containing protein n=1 Tax=Frigoribacterium sp. PhB24 TaxID=2485204 RepID=UPI000F469A4B|nr:SIS domain-containing protein [Frigoribacterium sp. PhB24]ROS52503.1 putative phosphosugar-binding protein [Frigoribacterium sp. PhB24]